MTDRSESADCFLLSNALLLHLSTSCSDTDSVLPTQEASTAGSSTEALLGLFAGGYQEVISTNINMAQT